MGGRQSSSSVSSAASATGNNATLSHNERGSPPRRQGATASTSSASAGLAFDAEALNEVEFTEDAAAILQRLTLASASRARVRGSLSSGSSNRPAASAPRRSRNRPHNGHLPENASSQDAQEVSSTDSDEDEDDDDERVSSRRPSSFPPRGGHRLPFRFGLFPVNGEFCLND